MPLNIWQTYKTLLTKNVYLPIFSKITPQSHDEYTKLFLVFCKRLVAVFCVHFICKLATEGCTKHEVELSRVIAVMGAKVVLVDVRVVFGGESGQIDSWCHHMHVRQQL